MPLLITLSVALAEGGATLHHKTVVIDIYLYLLCEKGSCEICPYFALSMHSYCFYTSAVCAASLLAFMEAYISFITDMVQNCQNFLVISMSFKETAEKMSNEFIHALV